MILVVGASYQQTTDYRHGLKDGGLTRHVTDAATLSSAIAAHRHHGVGTLEVRLLDGWSYERTDAQAAAILDVLTATGTTWLHVEAGDHA